MTDHVLTTEISDGGSVDEGCARVVCACGFEGVWMPPTLPDAEDKERPTVDYIDEVLIPALKAEGHTNENPADLLYEQMLARLKNEGHI